MSQTVYGVRHHYRYVYTAPITAVKQRLIMIPPDRHADQTLVSFNLDVRGTSGHPDIEWQTDAFGNRICHVEAEHVEHALDFEVRFKVRRGGSSPDVNTHRLPVLEACRAFTGLTAPNERIRAAAERIAAQTSSPREQVELVHDWAAGCLKYHLGVTGTQTPAAMALHLGVGVCQDFAHVMLSLVRCLGIAARYVSGHLVGEGAPHAWVEVVLDDGSLLAYDPTHHRRAGQNYITVAVGRDFADVTPTSGVFSGAAIGRLHWSKTAEILDSVEEEAA